MGRVDDLGELLAVDLPSFNINIKSACNRETIYHVGDLGYASTTYDLLPDPHPDLAMKLLRPRLYVLGDDLCQSGPERTGTDDGDLVPPRG